MKNSARGRESFDCFEICNINYVGFLLKLAIKISANFVEAIKSQMKQL